MTGQQSRRLRWAGGIGVMCWLTWSLAMAATGEGRYEGLIGSTAARFGLEPALVKALVHCESHFNSLAVSPRGAQGLMQLMPATQALLGVLDAFDPRDNISGGVQYLATLRQTFDGDVPLMLAAYNAGPQAVIDAGYTVPPFAETQRYVRCVLTARQRYRRRGFNERFAGETPGSEANGLVASPVHFSPRVVQVGQRVTVHFDARHTDAGVRHGVVMITYPESMVSFVVLRTSEHQTTVRLPAAPRQQMARASWGTRTYQFLQGDWPAWRPGERRTVRFMLVPRQSRELALHLSILVYNEDVTAVQHRWSTVVRLPVRQETW
jgi:hypothetical protein